MMFTVYGKPKGKARARTGKYGHYTPKETTAYEHAVRDSFLAAGGSLTNEPVVVKIDAFYAVPKSDTKAMRALKLSNVIPPTIKPDVDNVEKIVLDGLNGIAYTDDSHVIGATTFKQYDEVPRIEVRIDKYERRQ